MSAGEIALAVIALAIVTGLMTGFSSPWLRDPPRKPRRSTGDPLDNPITYLRDHGTPAEAERLGDQGVDLSGLGYRPPNDQG